MQIRAINNNYTNNNDNYRQNKIQGANYTPSLRGAKGFIIGAVTGGVVASLFNGIIFIYAALGAVIGDWIEDKNNNNDKNNRRNEHNLRLYR